MIYDSSFNFNWENFLFSLISGGLGGALTWFFRSSMEDWKAKRNRYKALTKKFQTFWNALNENNPFEILMSMIEIAEDFKEIGYIYAPKFSKSGNDLQPFIVKDQDEFGVYVHRSIGQPPIEYDVSCTMNQNEFLHDIGEKLIKKKFISKRNLNHF